MRNGFSVVAATACAVLAGGCGGSGTGGQSKAEVVAKANAICKSFEAQQKALAKHEPKSQAEYVQFFGQVQPLATRFVDELDALEPSGADREPFDRFIEISRTQVELIGDMQDAITAGDRARLQNDSVAFDAANVRSDIAAKQYGLTECLSDDWKTAA